MGNKQSEQSQSTTQSQTQTSNKQPSQQQAQAKDSFRRKIGNQSAVYRLGTKSIDCPQQWEQWLGFDPVFAAQFHAWILGTNNRTEIDVDTWLAICAPIIFTFIDPKLLESNDVISLLFTIHSYPQVMDSDTVYGIPQTTQILESIFNICFPGMSKAAIFQFNRIQDDTMREEYRVSYIISRVNSQLPAVNNYLKSAFQSLILFGTNQNQLPTLNFEYEILKPEYLTILSLGDHKLTSSLQILYSNVKSGNNVISRLGSSFNRLAWNILGYGGPTLFIIKLVKKRSEIYQYLESFQSLQYPIVYGALHSSEWSDGLKFQGDSSTYLFSISPCYRRFTTSKGGQNYAYLNTKFIDKSKYRVGLGFGGSNDYSQFRLWLDDDLENRSQVLADDDTYQTGYITGDLEGKLEIDRIEIWGLGGPAALEKQMKYRQERQEELERMRKVDKKQFLNSFDQEFLLCTQLPRMYQLKHLLIRARYVKT